MQVSVELVEAIAATVDRLAGVTDCPHLQTLRAVVATFEPPQRVQRTMNLRAGYCSATVSTPDGPIQVDYQVAQNRIRISAPQVFGVRVDKVTRE